jgi:bacterioferritin-associated ferredoxin
LTPPDIESNFQYQKAMIVCCCYGVSDRTIRKLAEEGATSVSEVTRSCGAGGDCGSCRRQIAQLLHDENARAEEARPLPMLLACGER